jgi:hypothetical protein
MAADQFDPNRLVLDDELTELLTTNRQLQDLHCVVIIKQVTHLSALPRVTTTS